MPHSTFEKEAAFLISYMGFYGQNEGSHVVLGGGGKSVLPETRHDIEKRT